MLSQLKDKTLLKEAAPIAGKWVSAKSGPSFSIKNPANNQEVGILPACSAEQTKKAIEAATKAQKSWAKKTAVERAQVVRKWYELILENKEDLGAILTAEQGKPLSEAIGEIQSGAKYFDWFAAEARRAYGVTIPAPEADKRFMVIKQPIGVCAAITPWNFPNSMIARKAAPAIALGCAMVLKPASATPFSAIAMAVLAERAGLPLELFSVVTGKSSEIGPVLTGSPLVRKFTFTGSTEIGAKLYEQCAPTIKKMSLELGGNAPFIVFDDADIDSAVTGAMLSKFRNNGQTCVCTNRFYVHDKVYDEFVSKFKDAASKLKLGDGMDKNTTMGPLIDEDALKKVEDLVNDVVKKGGKAVLGGKRSDLGGTYYEPTILIDAKSDMRIAKEEVFGPVAPVFRFTDEADAIAQANDTEFGLAAYCYTKDIARVYRVSEALEYGMVGVNTGHASSVEAPFGGVKHSGLGREGSQFGTDEFLEMKYISIGEIA